MDRQIDSSIWVSQMSEKKLVVFRSLDVIEQVQLTTSELLNYNLRKNWI